MASATAYPPMELGQLLLEDGPALTAAARGTAVVDITSDSRNAVANGLFLACDGVHEHGLAYLDDALAAGVAAVAWEPVEGVTEPNLPASVVGIVVDDLSAKVGDIADRFFSHPSQQINVTGITGTNGKTTTAWLTAAAHDRAAGATAYMGTLGYGRVPELAPSSLTTPGCIAVHRRLRELADAGVQHLVMEVSSHALDQGRVDGVEMPTAAFTNLSRDHLDYHGDMESYKAAKARLFEVRGLRSAVINVGDEFGAELAAGLASRLNVLTVAVEDQLRQGQQADLCATYRELQSGGLHIEFSGAYGAASLRSKLWGGFNAENLLVSVGILVSQGFSLDEALTAMDAGPVPPGRMEVVHGRTDAPAVIIDFAHTPDALTSALATARRHTGGKLICVFGCGGERDTGKRGEMGAVAGQLADHIVVTSDNPRSEDPAQIIAAIVAGIGAASHEVVADRATAIEAAIAAADADDTVLVAGKGAENYQLIGDAVLEFSDRAAAERALGVHA